MSKRKFLFKYVFEWSMPEDAIEADDTEDAEEQAIYLIMDSLRDGGTGDCFWEIESEEVDDDEVTDPYQVQVVVNGFRDFDYPCETLDEAMEVWQEQVAKVRGQYEAGELTSYIVEIWDNAQDIDIHSENAGDQEAA